MSDLEKYEVFVQWERGQPHEHAETVTAPDRDLALVFAKRNIDVRNDPVNIWVVPDSEVNRTAPDDTTLVPSTDRGYRSVGWYAENKIEVDSDDD